MLSKEYIQNLLATSDRAVARALVVLTERQTSDERASENTRYLNGRGFRPCHARMGTSMSKFFLRTGYLTPKQIAYWRAKDRSGSSRIEIYWSQLLEEAKMKAAQPKTEAAVAAAATNGIPVVDIKMVNEGRCYGNDMERKMVLQEQLGDVLDSDDPKLVDPIAAEIAELDAFWYKLRKPS